MGLISKWLDNRALKKDLSNKSKKLMIYVVIDLLEEQEDKKVLWYTPTVTEAGDYVFSQLYSQHREHYKGWCEIRDLDWNEEDSFKLYINECLGGLDSITERYLVQRVELSTGAVASLCNCCRNKIFIGNVNNG